VAYSVTRFDAIDEIDDGGAPYRPVRHHFGIASFGINSFTGHNTGDRIINEHSEEEDQEELYLVLQGRASFELDGERVDAPAGTLIFAEPGLKRTAFAEEDGTTVVVVGGKPGKAYEVLGFEIWAPFNPLYEAGDYAEAADQARGVIEAHPEAPGAFFYLACCEALAGRADDAARHLRYALEQSERLRSLARRNSDLDSIRDQPEIAELLAGKGHRASSTAAPPMKARDFPE
jgi:tetratricopeptide (TPR) repeat protein